MTVEERFWSKVNRTESCWLWTAAVNSRGYGQFRVGSKMVQVHRFSYQLANPNEDISTLGVLHRCDNPPCVRPEHLFSGTQQENSLDSISKNRCWRGGNGGWNKLTPEQILEIKARYVYRKVSVHKLAKEYNVGSMTIWRVVNNLNGSYHAI